VKKGPIRGLIWFKLIPGAFGPCTLVESGAKSGASGNWTKGLASSYQNWCKISPEDGGIPKVAPFPSF